MLRGDSLNISEAPPPALVEHGANIMMIEQGVQPPEGWAQDIPVAMRTPSLEARQVALPASCCCFTTAQFCKELLHRPDAFHAHCVSASSLLEPVCNGARHGPRQ